MKTLDKTTWKRQEHFEFFSQCDDPFFGINTAIHVTQAYQKCKINNWSFFLYYHFLSTQAINEVEEFKYRIKGDDIVIFDTIHTTTVLLRDDKTFMFSFMPFTPSFDQFVANAQEELAKAKNTTGIGFNENTARLDTIHYSAIPWINFTGLTHARSFGVADSSPKISFGKVTQETNDEMTMPLSVFVHHGLMDAYHVSLYIDRFQELLNS
ncbi:chloramphenicol acetyltransferase [uncultured Microscilla sp.]|uniref:chloramphenicol acetyltransferase n=1 Tax=uncultured Microscilla sp. TaxID=432653 RepID=UPI002626B41F|nr:chloramphenicol acetyltransferase [uncultured Microscilla sp.]